MRATKLIQERGDRGYGETWLRGDLGYGETLVTGRPRLRKPWLRKPWLRKPPKINVVGTKRLRENKINLFNIELL